MSRAGLPEQPVVSGGDPRRDFLMSLLETGLAAVDGRKRMRAALAGRRDLDGAWVLAAGKAAAAMTLGALDALGSRVARALVISREGHFSRELELDQRITLLAGGHPVPDARSLAAGESILRTADEVPAGRPVLLLVSGGASSLVEALTAGVGQEDLRRVSAWALGSGEPIERVNAVRRRLSRVKDGRLLARLAHARVEGFYISDVPGDDPATVGSGLLARSDEPFDAAGLPPWLAGLIAQPAPRVAATPKVPVTCVGRLDDALDAIESRALAAGIAVSRRRERLDGPVLEVAREACAALADMDQGLWLAGGETTVVLPPETGRGGRNQHLALAAAVDLAGRDDLLLLAAGSDGTDGNSEDAGGLVDSGTLDRGRDAGLDPQESLLRADSGRFLEASGDLVHTGPTGTNVGDLVLGLRWDAGHSLGRQLSM